MSVYLELELLVPTKAIKLLPSADMYPSPPLLLSFSPSPLLLLLLRWLHGFVVSCVLRRRVTVVR